MKKYKKLYHITGRTKGRKYVCTGPYSKKAHAIYAFLDKYPRFRGIANIYHENFHYLTGNSGLVESTYDGKIVEVFESAKNMRASL